MKLEEVLDFWLTQGQETLKALLQQEPIESVRGEILFPPGLPRDSLFEGPPKGVSREFPVQREGVGGLEVVKVTFGIFVQKVEIKG